MHDNRFLLHFFRILKSPFDNIFPHTTGARGRKANMAPLKRETILTPVRIQLSGYFDLAFPSAGLLGFTPMAFPRIVASGQADGSIRMPHGDGLVQDLHLFPRTI